MKQNYVMMLILSLLTACTGTFEAQPPIVIIVGQQDDATGLGVISLYDSALISNSVDVDLRQPFVSRNLPEESLAVDYDISDQLIERKQLYVLSRAGNSTDGFRHYLSSFGLERIDLANPDSFQQSSPALDLSSLASDALPSFPTTLCPTELVVEKPDFGEPRYSVLLNDAERCGGDSEDSGLLVLDLDNEAWLSFVTTIQAENVAVEAILLDQRNNRVYVPTRFLGQIKIRSLSLPDLSPTGFELELAINPDQLRDLSLVADQLVVLAADQFFYSSDLAAGASSDAQPTTELSLMLVEDESLRDSRVYILASNRLTVHESVTDEDEQSRSISRIEDATLDANAFMYLVADTLVQRFDTLIYDGSFASSFSSIAMPAIIEPVFASWAFADFTVVAE